MKQLHLYTLDNLIALSFKKFNNTELSKSAFSFIILIILSFSNAKSQNCNPTGGCPSFGTPYPNKTFTTTSSQWTLLTNTVGNPALISGGNYTFFSVVNGNTYEWSYCEDYGGVSTSWDPQITLFKESNLTTPICFAFDDCGINLRAPYMRWKADFTGTVRLLSTAYNGTQCQSTSSSGPFNKLVWRMVSSCTVATTANSALPANAAANLGSTATFNVSVSGTGPFNYYWFKNGTTSVKNTINSSNTTNSYTTPSLTTNDDGNTYHCVVYNCSASPSFVSRTATLTVTQNCVTPSDPPAPSKNSPSCGPVTLTRTGTVPSNETWYWQGTSCGTSKILGSAETYSANATGPYFLRAYNNTGGCWSTNCSSISVTVTTGPTVNANSNSPITAPASLNLTATTIAGASYSWTGPSNYTSTVQNPVRNPSGTAMSGDYCVTATLNGCSSVPSCTTVVINGTSVPTLNTFVATNIIDGHAGIDREHTLYNENATVTNKPIKICADGSTATYFKVDVSNVNGIGFRLVDGDDVELTDEDKDGKLGISYPIVGTNYLEVPYTHPQYMDENSLKRIIYIQITYNNNVINGAKFPLHIYRAPILFVHGWLGGLTSFEEMDNALINQGYYVDPLTLRVDYSNSSIESFYDNRNVIPNAINDLFRNARASDANFSCGKADVIAHSMGGILSRLYLQSGNYKKDFHKLITLNTPHSGSQGANFLHSIGNTSCPWFTWIKYQNLVCTPALANMRVNSWEITEYLNGSGLNRNIVPSFAISTEDILATDPDCKSVGVILYSGPNGLLDYALIRSIFNFEANDLVVPISSQRGGLSKYHHFFNQCHLSSAKNSSIVNYVTGLLNAAPNSTNFDINGFDPPILNSIYSKPVNTNKVLTGNLTITNPINGSNHYPGEQIIIQTNGTTNIQKTIIGVGNLDLPVFAKDTLASSTSTLYNIPDDAIGEIRIICIAYDTSGGAIIDLDTVRINISVGAALDSIKVYSSKLEIPLGSQAPISVIGYFHDGIIRDISKSDSLVFSIDNISIASHFNQNVFTGNSIGVTLMNISFRNKTIEMPVEVYKGENTVSTILSSDKKQICIGNPVNFSDISLGNPVSRKWEFPGGNPATSNEINPIITYNNPGNFDVVLIATYANKTDTLLIPNYISVNTQLLVGSDSTNLINCSNETLDISGLYNVPGLSREWDIPDPSHAKMGQHKLILTSSIGCADTININIKQDVKVWYGEVSDDWHNSLNWSGNSVPGDSTHVIIQNPNKPCVIRNADVKVASVQLIGGSNYTILNNHKLIITANCDSLPQAPPDVTVTKLPSDDPTTSGGRTTISITIEIAAINKDAYISKTVSPFDVEAADAGGIGAVIKVEGVETLVVMNNVAGGFYELTSLDGAIDKTSSFLIKANTKAKMVVKALITDTRGIYGKYTLVLTMFKTFSNAGLTEGKIQKKLDIVSKDINL